jgi:hypothetical protein
VNLARTAAKEDCDGSRTECNDTCVDPIDKHCVRNCKADLRVCAADAKKDERTCKKACAKGPTRKACIRACRAEMNGALGDCSDDEILCLTACMELPPS